MVEVRDSSLTFASVYESDYAPKDPALKDANMLLIPYCNYRPGIEYCFGEYSEEFLSYVRENENERIKVDIAISDERYQAMEMHSLLLDIGIFLVKDIILPVALGVLSNYVFSKVNSMHEKKENVNVRVEIIAQEPNGRSKAIRYDGPASGFDAVKEAASKVLEP